MNIFVKEFIENNVDLIEKGIWSTFFRKWYVSCPVDDEPKLFEDLCNTLAAAEIVTLTDTESARRNIIEEFSDSILNKMHRLGDDGACIYVYQIRERLVSFLGFSETEVDKIIIKGLSEIYEYDDSRNGFLVC